MRSDECWFCGERPSSDGKGYDVSVISVEDRLFTGGTTNLDMLEGHELLEHNNIPFYRETINVPRCDKCYSEHEGALSKVGNASFLGVIPGALAGYYISRDMGLFYITVLTIVFVSLGFGLFVFLFAAVFQRGRKNPTVVHQDASDFPEVARLLDRGWRLGYWPDPHKDDIHVHMPDNSLSPKATFKDMDSD